MTEIILVGGGFLLFWVVGNIVRLQNQIDDLRGRMEEQEKGTP